MSYGFKGGVHPEERKAPNIPVTVIAPPPQVVIPLVQHIGAPCQPTVKAGDAVTVGQLIGENPAPVSAPVHSTVSGKVIAVEPRPHPLGDTVMSVVIENDGLDTPCNDYAPMTEEQLKDPDAIIERIRACGVVGMGGAMFPTAYKISSVVGEIDTMIINAAECEPYLNEAHLTMRLYPDEFLKGIELARIAARVKKVYIGIEKNKQDVIDLLSSKHPEQYGIEIVPEKVKYPQGSEKMQIKSVTGKRLKPGKLPASLGIIVLSPRTCYAIYEACYLGKPLTERIVTVAGDAMKAPVNALIRFGTPYGYIAEQCGGFAETPGKVMIGGPMMGISSYTLDTPTVKGAAGLLFLTKKEDRFVEEPTCIHCGKCIEACPMNLEPVFMYMYYNKGDLDTLEKYHVKDCFECGSCTFICPARLPLTHTFKTAKLALQARAAKAKETAK